MRPLKRCSVAVLLALLAALTVPTGSGLAQDAKLQTLEERMADLQAGLDAATARVDQLWVTADTIRLDIGKTDLELAAFERKTDALEERVVEIATGLYMNGGGEAALQAVLGSEGLTEATSNLIYVESAAQHNDKVLFEFDRAASELQAKRDAYQAKVDGLTEVEARLDAEWQDLHEQFVAASDEYDALKKKMEAKALAEARALAAAARSQEGRYLDGPPPGPGFVCPIDGPNSFIDSWGFPRSGGRTHEGADIMAAFDTPVVALTDGRITYAGVGSLSGNWLILTDDEGHEYMYMHNKENVVTQGPVRAGQLIATVGDTGNAVGGPPHVHFEYHPNGGEPVNPFELLNAVCR